MKTVVKNLERTITLSDNMIEMNKLSNEISKVFCKAVDSIELVKFVAHCNENSSRAKNSALTVVNDMLYTFIPGLLLCNDLPAKLKYVKEELPVFFDTWGSCAKEHITIVGKEFIESYGLVTWGADSVASFQKIYGALAVIGELMEDWEFHNKEELLEQNRLERKLTGK